MTPLELARSKVEAAYDLIGPSPTPQERANWIHNAENLATKYGISAQWAELSSALMKEGADEDLAKMAAFWAAREVYAPDHDGGAARACEELALANATAGAAIDAESAKLAALLGPDLVDDDPDIVEEPPAPVAPEEPPPLGELIEQSEEFIRREYKQFYTTEERAVFNQWFDLTREFYDVLTSVRHAHTQVIHRRFEQAKGG